MFLGLAPLTDLLRLLAVPIFLWAAWRDIKVRRVPNKTWLPLLALGFLLLAWDGLTVLLTSGGATTDFIYSFAISIGLVPVLAYLLWYSGGFGGADAKALMVLSLLFFDYPTYYLPTTALPMVKPTIDIFAFTVFSNAVLLAALYPVGLFVLNLLRREVSPVMVLGRAVTTDSLDTRHGRLLETPDGYTRRGVDLDTLRMYFRWRGISLNEFLDAPSACRDFSPAVEHSVGDGSTRTDGGTQRASSDGEMSVEDPEVVAEDDPWAADRFFESIDQPVYGATPEDLRAALELLSDRETVWVSPGMPFFIPLVIGLVVALTYGDLMVAFMEALL